MGALILGFAVLWLFLEQRKLKRRILTLEKLVVAGPATDTAQSEAAPDAAAPGAAAPDDTPPPLPWPESARAITPGASEPPDPVEPSPPRGARLRALFEWLRTNWFYAISALSLALAGVFLVQYGVENGLLPPTARVIATLLLGAALIAGGEVIRRRFGDHEGASSAHLPSTLSGAGVVTLFVGVLSARMLYDLIGVETAFAGLVIVAAIGITLGWFYGPFLAAIGILGAMITPFVVGGSSDSPDPLYGYFVLIAVAGLAVDSVRRWAWVSVLSVVLGVAGVLVIHLAANNDAALIAAMTALALFTIAIPVLRLSPDHEGPCLSAWVAARVRGARPVFPVMLAAGTMMAAVTVIAMASNGMGDVFWLAALALLALFVALAFWCRGAAGLDDLAAVPALGLLAAVWMQAAGHGPVWRAFRDTATQEAPDFAAQATILLAMAALVAALCAWRSTGRRHPRVWAVAAVLAAPVMAGMLEVMWQPGTVIGAYPWALHAAGVAVALTFLAERYSARDGEDRFRAAVAALGALSMMTFALMLVLSDAALTVAIAATMVAAAALDRRFTLPALSLFIQASIAVIGWRLVVEPGVVWGRHAPLGQVLLAYGGAIAAMVAALVLLAPLRRPGAKIVLDSAIPGTTGVLLSLLLYRWIAASGGPGAIDSHWALALQATVWLSVGMAQLDRMRAGGALAQVRLGLGLLAGVSGLAVLVASLTVGSPLAAGAAPVLGVPGLSTLTVACLLPAALFMLAAWRLDHLPRLATLAFRGAALALVAVWIGLSIRHFWRGADLSVPGTSTAELYSYTVALLLAGGLALQQAIARRSVLLRRLALGLIGLSVAKVFFVDAAGLDGLARVFSFLALGLVLAGLAWLDRWASQRAGDLSQQADLPDTPP